MPHRIEVSTDRGLFDVKAIQAFLGQTYWARGIPLATVEKAVLNSVCAGAYLGSEQIGFARVVTDQATFAYLADVYVLEAHRGQGLARRIVGALIDHPELQGLRRWMLATRDAQGLYRQFGFKPLASPSRFMEVHDPDVYLRAPPGAA